jgi:hypothetical protein
MDTKMYVVNNKILKIILKCFFYYTLKYILSSPFKLKYLK